MLRSRFDANIFILFILDYEAVKFTFCNNYQIHYFGECQHAWI